MGVAFVAFAGYRWIDPGLCRHRLLMKFNFGFVFMLGLCLRFTSPIFHILPNLTPFTTVLEYYLVNLALVFEHN